MCRHDNITISRVLPCIPRFVPFRPATRAHNSRHSERDLSSLFGDVLDIALADHLPVLNEAKTYSLSLWTLGCHRLPATVLDSRRDDLLSALQRSLEARQSGNIVLDGLKVGFGPYLLFLRLILPYQAISHTIECHPSAFLELLSPLLPHVTTNLICQSSEHRLHASIALGQFANALIHQTEFSLSKWQSLSNHITSFLEACCDGSQVARDTCFPRMIRAAFSAEPHAHHTDAPAWILAVFASLIVLCGPPLYEKPTVLQFILQSLAVALTHKRSVIRALHPHVWRCFVWTFSQMLLSSENMDVDPASISSALYIIKQEVSGGIGVALAGVLLSDRIPATRSDDRGSRISQVLSVIKAMVRTECKHTCREGFMFLRALTNDAQARHEIAHNMYEMPASALFNGAIVRAEWDGLPSIIHTIPKAPVSVHWPEETEVARHYKTLLVIWKHCASNRSDVSSARRYIVHIFNTRPSIKPGLVDVWLSILLACSHQLEFGHITTTAATEMLGYAATIIVEFLPLVPPGDGQPDWGSWNVQDQLCSLTFINQLWSAMQRTFATFSLAAAAEFILTSILKYAFHVLDLDVQTLWGRLCANLMITAPPSFLRDVHSASPQLVIRSQREVWGVVATSLSSSALDFGWKDLVKFLAIPIWYLVSFFIFFEI